jgi:hypothetical protein
MSEYITVLKVLDGKTGELLSDSNGDSIDFANENEIADYCAENGIKGPIKMVPVMKEKKDARGASA